MLFQVLKISEYIHTQVKSHVNTNKIDKQNKYWDLKKVKENIITYQNAIRNKIITVKFKLSSYKSFSLISSQ